MTRRRERGITLLELLGAMMLAAVIISVLAFLVKAARSVTAPGKTCKELIDEATAAQNDLSAKLASGSLTAAQLADAMDQANTLTRKAKACLINDTEALVAFLANVDRINAAISTFASGLNPEDAALLRDKRLQKP